MFQNDIGLLLTYYWATIDLPRRFAWLPKILVSRPPCPNRDTTYQGIMGGPVERGGRLFSLDCPIGNIERVNTHKPPVRADRGFPPNEDGLVSWHLLSPYCCIFPLFWRG